MATHGLVNMATSACVLFLFQMTTIDDDAADSA